jgi:hypothetical protein
MAAASLCESKPAPAMFASTERDPDMQEAPPRRGLLQNPTGEFSAISVAHSRKSDVGNQVFNHGSVKIHLDTTLGRPEDAVDARRPLAVRPGVTQQLSKEFRFLPRNVVISLSEIRALRIQTKRLREKRDSVIRNRVILCGRRFSFQPGDQNAGQIALSGNA